MRKLISILLLLFFANPIFATTPPTPKVETTLNINITDTTKENLKNAIESFNLEIEKARKNNCNGKNFKKDFCEEKFSTTKKFIKGEIAFSTTTTATEEDFKIIVAFYNELKKFKKLQAEFEILNSRTKTDIIAHYELLKTNLEKLIEKLNKENELLNPALKNTKNENKIPTTTTTITEDQIQNINTKINNVKNSNLKQHTKKDIKIPTIPSTAELNNKDDEKLNDILTNLQTLQDKISKETEIADSNIAELEKNEAINNALNNLKDAKKEQAKLLSQLGKNKITINDGNDNDENTELNNNFPIEVTDSTYQPNNVVTDLTVENIQKETTNVQKNNKLLEKYIKSQLNDCKKILSELINPKTVNENITLQNCQTEKETQQKLNEELTKAIKDNFEYIIQLINEISKLELIIYADYDQFDPQKPPTEFNYTFLGYSNGGKKAPIDCVTRGLNINTRCMENIKNSKITCNDNCHDDLNIPLLYNEIINIDKETITSNQRLSAWRDYTTDLAKEANTNISNMNKYIENKKAECKLDDFAWNDEDKLKNLDTEVKICINRLNSKPCNDFKGLINNSYFAEELTKLGGTVQTYNINNPEQCIKELNQNNCQEYINASKATNITLSEIEERNKRNKINIEKNTLDYLKECKNYVDVNTLPKIDDKDFNDLCDYWKDLAKKCEDKDNNGISYNCNIAITDDNIRKILDKKQNIKNIIDKYKKYKETNQQIPTNNVYKRCDPDKNKNKRQLPTYAYHELYNIFFKFYEALNSKKE